MTTTKSLRARLLGSTGTIAAGLLLATAAVGLSGCRPGEEEPGVHVASWAMVDARQRHPIVVSNEPANLDLRIAATSNGLSPSQRAQAIDFFRRYRGSGADTARLAIGVPSGGANDVAAVRALADLRVIVHDAGISESEVSVRPYRAARTANAPIKMTFARFVAEAPECGSWPDNLANDRRNLPYANFGCATQRNLAVQVANPADLLGPRAVAPAAAERRDTVYEKYVAGKVTHADKSNDERLQVKGAR
jgi:pilus assembly protein CpaD